MQSIAVFTTRGGAGKSATTVFLADFLSTVFSKRILVVDLDPQASAAKALLGDEQLYEHFGNGRSLPKLLREAKRSKITKQQVGDYLIPRNAVIGRGKHLYLQQVDILACEKESWLELHYDLTEHRKQPQDYITLLHDTLMPVRLEYDICLLDFPAHSIADPMTYCGLRAALWWLLPAVPDKAGLSDLESPLRAIQQMRRDYNHEIKGLGTLLTLCQRKNGREYNNSRNALRQLEKDDGIPRLFSQNAEISFHTDVKNALDDSMLEKYRTLPQRYGPNTKALYSSSRALAKEVLDRLQIPYPNVPSLTFGERFAERFSRIWRR